jgi:tetratricopeptide (TPR) repeat protein
VTTFPGSRRLLPHLAYIEALAETDEDTPRWQVLTAGYAALQTFDAWTGRPNSLTFSLMDLRRVRRRLALVSEGDPIRRCLTQLVDAMERAESAGGRAPFVQHADELGRVLAAYGKLLQYEGAWSLARDVFETLADFALLVGDTERLLDSFLMVGFSLRMLSSFDEARAAYERLRRTAATVRSEQYLLLAELGFAKIAIERGNLPAAAGMLDRILDEASEEKHGNVRAKALMDRARVAEKMGDYASAAILNHQALACSTDSADRDRLLVNIGLTLTQLGLWDQARDAYLVAGATAQEATVRWMAHVNLMELAYLTGNQLLFEQHDRAVGGATMPPYVEAVYHETRAHGFCAFGKHAEAEVEFRAMLRVAERNGLNEFVIRADRALGDVSHVTPPLSTTARRQLDRQATELSEVADTLTRMRVSAGV